MTRIDYLRLAAPYAAVLFGWQVARSALVTLAIYSGLMLLMSAFALPRIVKGWSAREFITGALPFALVGVGAYLVLPHVPVHMPLRMWLQAFGVRGETVPLILVWFGLVHPLLEQAHWSGPRLNTPAAHVAFAGYHGFILQTFLPVPWLIAVVAALGAVSWTWASIQRRTGGVLVPALGHLLADAGLAAAVWMIIS